jgi:hypothetical protein
MASNNELRRSDENNGSQDQFDGRSTFDLGDVRKRETSSRSVWGLVVTLPGLRFFRKTNVRNRYQEWSWRFVRS